VRLTFYGQKNLVDTNRNGSLVRLPAGTPRVFGLVEPPCTSDGCSGRLQLGLYLDAPGRVAVRFSATKSVHRIQTGKQIQTLRAGEPTTIRFSLPKGDQGVNIPVDWTSPEGAPQIEAVAVQTAGKTIRLW
jgi:hypothetical protein